MADRPVSAAAARAFFRAFSANVVPVSGASSTPAGSASSSYGCISAESSRSLWSLRVERISRTASAGRSRRNRVLLGGAKHRDPVGGEGEQRVERGARERGALRRGLHLHEATVAGHHHVGVDLGPRVL